MLFDLIMVALNLSCLVFYGCA